MDESQLIEKVQELVQMYQWDSGKADEEALFIAREIIVVVTTALTTKSD